MFGTHTSKSDCVAIQMLYNIHININHHKEKDVRCYMSNDQGPGC